MDKRIYKQNKNIIRSIVKLDNGNQEVLHSCDAVIGDDSKEAISHLVRNILLAIKEFFDYSDLQIVCELDNVLTVKSV